MAIVKLVQQTWLATIQASSRCGWSLCGHYHLPIVSSLTSRAFLTRSFSLQKSAISQNLAPSADIFATTPTSMAKSKLSKQIRKEKRRKSILRTPYPPSRAAAMDAAAASREKVANDAGTQTESSNSQRVQPSQNAPKTRSQRRLQSKMKAKAAQNGEGDKVKKQSDVATGHAIPNALNPSAAPFEPSKPADATKPATPGYQPPRKMKK